MSVSERLHYMDNLRALTMITGVFFHAALAYSPFLQAVWLSSDSVTSPAIDWFANFTHIFRMPLFFIVAGFFSALLIERRGSAGLFKNRLLRILLPFIVFWPIVTMAIVLPLGWALNNVENLPPLLQYIKSIQNVPDAPKPPPSTYHLWFLYYLMVFYVLLWVARTLVPPEVKAFFIKVHPLRALFVFPLLLVPGLLLGLVPYPAPESFIPQLWAILFFGLFFAFGYLLYFSMHQLEYLSRYWPGLLAASVLLFIPFQWLYPEKASFTPQNLPWPERVAMILCLIYIAAFMCVACLVLARKCLDGRNKIMRFFSDASYWIYLVHLPIVFFIQYILLDKQGGVLYKFLLSSLLTLAICVLTYVVFVRWTPIGWMLNGRKKSSL